MPVKKKQPLQRLIFSADQQLKASDLNETDDYESSLRSLHVRGLHDTWGVALGYYLSLSEGKDQVLVGPGLAYDALGGEVLLSSTLTLPAPEAPSGSNRPLVYDLAVSRRSRDEIVAARKQRLGCSQEDPAEGVALRWVLAGEQQNPSAGVLAKGLRLGLEVPLGRFIYETSTRTLNGPHSGFSRIAQPLLRPHIAYGQVMLSELEGAGAVASYTKEVLTVDEGFHSTPQYFAFLPENKLLAQNQEKLVFGPLLSVSSPQYDRFTLRCSFATPYIDPNELPAGYREWLISLVGDLTIVWIGVEMVTGIQLLPSPLEIFTLAGFRLKNFDQIFSGALEQIRSYRTYAVH